MRFVNCSLIPLIVVVVAAVTLEGCGDSSFQHKDLQVVWDYGNSKGPRPALTAEQKNSFATLHAMDKDEFDALARKFVDARIAQTLGAEYTNASPAAKKDAVDDVVKAIKQTIDRVMRRGGAGIGHRSRSEVVHTSS